MHHLSPLSRRKALSLERSEGCQNLVRFFALLRIKPHAPPLVRAPSIPLSFNLAVVLPRVLNALAAALKPRKGLTPSTHRLRRGLPGYLILFAPPTLSSLSVVTSQRAAFATGVPPYIYAFHRYTWNSTLPLHSVKTVSKAYYG